MFTHRVNIEDISRDGGVATLEGKVYFIKGAFPDELVEFEIIEEKRDYGYGEVVNVIQSSSERIAPRCEHWEDCGGCPWQVITPSLQLKLKKEILRSSLERIAGIEYADIDVFRTPDIWNYRYRARLLSKDRKLGFRKESEEDVVSLKDCHILNDRLSQLIPHLSEICTDYEGELILRTGIKNEEVQILFCEALSDRGIEMVRKLAERYQYPLSVFYTTPEHIVLICGNECLKDKWNAYDISISPLSFTQANMKVFLEVYKIVAKNSGSGEIAWDVYGGIGAIALHILPAFLKVYSIEEDRSSVSDMEINFKNNEFENAVPYLGKAEEILEYLDGLPDFVIFNPPATGVNKKVLKIASNRDVKKIAYLSCDPGTFSRDAKMLTNSGYDINKLLLIDAFPHTTHLENLAIFRKVKP
jgi:23S rRNA (uracil1939-C5)-methyltransferase